MDIDVLCQPVSYRCTRQNSVETLICRKALLSALRDVHFGQCMLLSAYFSPRQRQRHSGIAPMARFAYTLTGNCTGLQNNACHKSGESLSCPCREGQWHCSTYRGRLGIYSASKKWGSSGRSHLKFIFLNLISTVRITASVSVIVTSYAVYRNSDHSDGAERQQSHIKVEL